MLAVVEVVVDEKVGVTPFVGLEHFKCHGNEFAIGAKVVEYLHVNLGYGALDAEDG